MSNCWQKSFISQIWRRFVLFVVSIQLIVIVFFYLEGGVIVGTRLGTSMAVLLDIVDVVFRQDDPVLLKQVVEVLDKDAGIKFLPSTAVKDVIDLPPYPALRVFAKTVNTISNKKIVISYQRNPYPILWLQKNEPPAFALGVPFIGNRFFIVFVASAFFIIFLGAIYMGWWIAKRINQPLLKLANDALQMANDHEADGIILERGSLSEIIVLADSLNKMHANIYRMIKEHEVFLAEISHDLRTPLSRLRVALEMLDSDSPEFVDGMKEDIEEMTSILKQTIELAHINLEENGQWIEGDINELLSEVHTKYQRAGFSLGLNLAPMPNIRFRKVALTRLLYNLVDNGLKYGNGSVSLISYMDNDTPTISIVNSHKILNNNDQLNLFQAYNKHDISMSNGLGLQIVERIALMHGITLKTTEHTDYAIRQVSLSFTDHHSVIG